MDKVAILQARLGSTRLPGKVLLEVSGKPLIEWQIRRINKGFNVPVVVATSTDESDDPLADYLKNIGVEFIRGPLSDVAERFRIVIDNYKPKYFIRLTADCPLVMPDLIRDMDERFNQMDVDYLSNTINPTYPDGLDVEFVKSSSFLQLKQRELTQPEKEHVTLGLYRGHSQFKLYSYEHHQDLSHHRWTVDYPEDFEFVNRVFGNFPGQEIAFKMEDVLSAIHSGVIENNSLSPELRNVSLNESERSANAQF